LRPAWSIATAAEDLVAVAPPEAVLLGVLPEVEEGDEPEPLLAPAPIAVAFFLPQVKDWQKFCPARSLGCNAVHWAFHSSHSREGRVCE
jgi:hypothetical protein